MTLKVVVVGGGIIGLSCAYRLIHEFPHLHFTLISEALSPETTSDGAAGLWTPYLLSGTPPHLIKEWSLATLDFFLQLWKRGDGGELGLSLFPVFLFGSADSVPPVGALGLHELTPEEMRRLNVSPGSRRGYSYTTFTCEPRKILPYFLEEFKKSGGTVECRRVNDLEILTKDFDIVVHCTGLGASKLMKDESLFPVRGQVHRVKAPHIFYAVMDTKSGGYVIPNQDAVVLGGTSQQNDWNRNVNQVDKDDIFSKCVQLIPGLKNATVLEDWVGLRPARTTVCLEKEKIIGINGKLSVIIHNYGHGGSGITLFWGCALHVEKLLRQSIHEIHNYSPKSKL